MSRAVREGTPCRGICGTVDALDIPRVRPDGFSPKMADKRALALPADLLVFLGARSVREAAQVLGVGHSTVQLMRRGGCPVNPHRVLAAWDAYPGRTNPVSPAIFASIAQSLDTPKSAPEVTLAPNGMDTLARLLKGTPNRHAQAAPAAPNPANLDKTGKRYVLAGCMVDLPDLAMAKVGRVEDGRWWLPAGLEPHPTPCNSVRVLMRTFSESMGSFYWA